MVALSWMLPLALLCHLTMAVPLNMVSRAHNELEQIISKAMSPSTDYPKPNHGGINAHDPNIIMDNGAFYMFKGSVHLAIHKSISLNGPWDVVGHVLEGDAKTGKSNATRPWAPTTVFHNNKFYCFYAVSNSGSQDSSIGVASADKIEGKWTDHGALINTGSGEGSKIHPYSVTNAIDPAFIVDEKTKQPYLVWGSYWDNIWSVPLEDDLLAVKNHTNPEANHLAYIKGQKFRPQEGSFMTSRDGYYYLWFSLGRCCDFGEGKKLSFPTLGDEYHIRVGRSKDAKGPFVDRSGKKLLEGGGTTVYASNHDTFYAPGGLGVMAADQTNAGKQDILYYHYLNRTLGFDFVQAQLGWNYLDYEDGWPVAVKGTAEPIAKGGSKPATQTKIKTKTVTKTNAAPKATNKN